MKERDGVDGLILGGTELSLILREPTAAGLPVLDSTQIHVDAAVGWLLGLRLRQRTPIDWRSWLGSPTRRGSR